MKLLHLYFIKNLFLKKKQNIREIAIKETFPARKPTFRLGKPIANFFLIPTI